MNNILQTINIDLCSSSLYEVTKVQQGDHNSRIIELFLYEQGNAYEITDNLTLRFTGYRGNGSAFFKDDCVSAEKNCITVTLTNDILYYAGTIEAKITLYDTSNRSVLSTIPFQIVCEKTPCHESSLTRNERSIITDLIFQVDEFSESAAKAIAQLEENVNVTTNNAKISEECKTISVESSRIAEISANTATKKAAEAIDSANTARSYTCGDTDLRPGEASDNAKYYYTHSKKIYDDFAHAGNVVGVKGNAQSNYQTGFVNLTAENIGALPNSMGKIINNAYNQANSAYERANNIYDAIYDENLSLGRNANAYYGSYATALGAYSYATGNYSTALGYDANASNYGGTAIGYNTHTSDLYSTAVGYCASASMNESIALGSNANAVSYSTALGCNANASNSSVALGAYSCATDSSIALGHCVNALGNRSIVLGYDAKANGIGSIALGSSVLINSNYSTALGAATDANGNYSTALGYYAGAFGNHSSALGSGSCARGNHSTALGYYSYVAAANTNTIQLGNASSLSTLSCRVALSVTSDERDKADITEIEDGALEFLNKIHAIRYVFNHRELYIDEETLPEEEKEKKAKFGLCEYDKEAHKNGSKKGSRMRVGVSAQEVQKALAEIYGDSSYANLINDNLFDINPENLPEGVENQLTANYEGFIPFLIKAVQELSQQLSEKTTIIDELDTRIHILEEKKETAKSSEESDTNE